MKGINSELNKTIERECLIKDVVTKAKHKAEVNRPINRRRIEDILEAKQLEASIELSIE
tara:strand:+ start:7370 stop:7546 length:177 start_codon:yes stop_codon:yes gene_type:complete